ncbi:MAG: hypothetical protein AAF152_14440 [Cyanobacteria bacterium P01_A01_bin.114]
MINKSGNHSGPMTALRLTGQKWLDKGNRILTRLLSQPRTQLILNLTAVWVILHGIDHFAWVTLPERLLAAAILIFPQGSRGLWLGTSVLLSLNNLNGWSVLVNHEYLITYWVIVCAIAVWSTTPKKVLAWNARLLIGLCFLFATLWKFISGEYLNGSFLHLTFLLDSRLEMGAVLMGGINPESLATNQRLFETLQTTTAPLALETTPLLSVVSVILSYWTLLIEGGVAIAFLMPGLKWLYQRRDGLLMLFIVTTYSVIPVFGFGAILMIMGLAQCKNVGRQRLYLAMFLLMPLWMPLPQSIFYVMGRFWGLG